jgi:branched-chain amino acid transport system ATP-binding protein
MSAVVETTRAAALRVEGVVAGYGDKTVLRRVGVTVPEGGAVAILGPNGAGKTTLLGVLSGLIPVSSGKIFLGDNDITSVSAHRRAQRGLCHIPDPRGIFPSLTVAENLTLQSPKGVAGAAIDRAVEAFPRLGERLTQRAGTLSGGEQQMLAVSRAYVQNPSVVLLDEVSMGLAPNLVDEIFLFLERLLHEGVALVVVEQFVHRALALVSEVIVLAKGAVRLRARADEVTEDQIFAAYAGIDRQQGARRAR